MLILSLQKLESIKRRMVWCFSFVDSNKNKEYHQPYPSVTVIYQMQCHIVSKQWEEKKE